MSQKVVTCDYCGSGFLRHQSNIRERNFCNRKCWGKHLSKKNKMQPLSKGLAAHQKHYQIAPVELIEILQMYLPPEQFQGYLRGNALKYLLRMGHKDEPKKEIDKAYQFSKWLRQAANGETINPRQED